MEAKRDPDIHGPADGHRTATGPCPDGAIAKLGFGKQITNVS